MGKPLGAAELARQGVGGNRTGCMIPCCQQTWLVRLRWPQSWLGKALVAAELAAQALGVSRIGWASPWWQQSWLRKSLVTPEFPRCSLEGIPWARPASDEAVFLLLGCVNLYFVKFGFYSREGVLWSGLSCARWVLTLFSARRLFPEVWCAPLGPPGPGLLWKPCCCLRRLAADRPAVAEGLLITSLLLLARRFNGWILS